ncbi:hypothetical protein [Terrihalobacillus insolitus]|uniref:hypothetical protein n=1 Tax=Terrihalobacillus insolitus TaxID=2950438 RepID=UPI002342233C|nr:hypothetical protein [Terrihalobacillus insolitus]MDC3412506.1 hypothetical protein [Terrihalobacillus insolitus]
MKKQLMMVAWSIAKSAANIHGGTKKEWFAYGLTKAWKFTKEGKLEEKFNQKFGKKAEVKSFMKGNMTEKQESFITSLLKKKSTDNPVAQAFNVSSLRSRISKKQASDLINELLAS